MAAPLKNKNHLKYPPAKVKSLFNKAIIALNKDGQIFNYPHLHQSIGLKTQRTLPYLAERYKDNAELMELWNKLRTEQEKNLLKHLKEMEFNRSKKIYFEFI